MISETLHYIFGQGLCLSPRLSHIPRKRHQKTELKEGFPMHSLEPRVLKAPMQSMNPELLIADVSPGLLQHID